MFVMLLQNIYFHDIHLNDVLFNLWMPGRIPNRISRVLLYKKKCKIREYSKNTM